MLVRHAFCLMLLPSLTFFLIIYFRKMYMNKRKCYERFVSIKLTEEEKDLIHSKYDSVNIEKYDNLIKRHGFKPSIHSEKNFCDLKGLYKKQCDNKLAYASK